MNRTMLHIQDEPAGGVVHAQRLCHVVERQQLRQEVAPMLPRPSNQRATRHEGERQHQREGDAGWTGTVFSAWKICRGRRG